MKRPRRGLLARPGAEPFRRQLQPHTVANLFLGLGLDPGFDLDVVIRGTGS